MPATVELTWEESQGMTEAQVGVLVTGVDNRADLIAALLSNLPASYGTLVFKSLDSARLVQGQTDLWNCQVSYGAYQIKEELKEGESEFKFSSSRRSITQTLSPSSRCFDGTGEIDIEDKYLIGWKPFAEEAQGTQANEYLNAFSWRVAVPFSLATEAWRREIGRLRGTVCATGFFGYEYETVKFNDITGGVRGSGLYLLELSFEQIDHPGTVVVGGITVPNLKAWEIIDPVDVGWKVVTVGGKKRRIPRVDRVKVHYLETVANWSAIGDLLAIGLS